MTVIEVAEKAIDALNLTLVGLKQGEVTAVQRQTIMSIQGFAEIIRPPSVKFTRVPDYSDLIPIDQFLAATNQTFITNDDGLGYFATSSEESDVPVDCGHLEVPYWATHVAWYNK